MLNRFKKVFEKLPDPLFALAVTIYWHLHPNRENLTILPYENYWLVKCKEQRFLTPDPHYFNYIKRSMIEKYTFKPFVDIELGDVVFDIGSFIGGFTLAVASKASKVVAIEPNPIIFNLLCKNVRALKNVVVIQKALWNRTTKMKLNICINPTDSTLLSKGSTPHISSIEIYCVRLDELVEELDIKKIDFLKLDAEGAEPEVLEGAEGVADRIRKMAIDCSSERFGSKTVSQVTRILHQYGFTTLLHNDIVYARKN